MELLGSRLDVFQNVCQPRMVWICLSQQRSAWVIAMLLPSLHLLISPYFSSAWKLTRQWELQRNLYLEVFFIFPSGKPPESMKTHSYVFPQEKAKLASYLMQNALKFPVWRLIDYQTTITKCNRDHSSSLVLEKWRIKLESPQGGILWDSVPSREAVQ